LFGIAAGGEFRLFEQADAAGEVLDGLLAAGLEFHLAAAGFLEAGAFAFEFLLDAFEFGEFLLGLADL
jgi:hypothetical protein